MAKTMEKCCLNAFMTGFEFLKSIKFIFLPHYLVYLLFCFTTCMANKVDQKDLYKYLGSTCSRTKHYATRLSYAADNAHRPPLHGFAVAACSAPGTDGRTNTASFLPA